MLNFPKEKIRLGVFTFYLSQGLCFSSWASRIPDIKDSFDISDTFMWGLLLFMIPVGKFLAIPLAGYSVSKFGSKQMVQVSILGYALALFTVGFATNIYILGACLFLFGVFWNLMDISLNTQGIGIEKLFDKNIMGSFHGAWSLAACFGALLGFIMINFQIPYFYHFAIVLAVIALSWMVNRKYLQADAPIAQEEIEEADVVEKTSALRMPELVLIQLGLVGLFALVVESAMFDWGGVYFESIVKAPKSLQIGFLVFMVMMTVGRFITSWAYSMFGKKRTIQISGCLILVGMFLSAIFPSIILTSLGFMLVGLGISCVVPTMYSVVGEKSKTPTSLALTILSSISFVGSLIAPLLIGSISHNLNMKYAYMVVGLLGGAIVIITSVTSVMDDTKK
ncbi:MAG: hypothetical protein RL662_609 [Bacteroidota bacterium]|jgi:MFS family permease